MRFQGCYVSMGMTGLMAVALLSGLTAIAPKPRLTKELLALGERIYQERCAICHGRKGDGKGEAAYLLYPRPRDFTRAVFKIRSTPSGTLPTDEDLFRTVSEGMPGTAMLPWKDILSERERWAVVGYLKTFSPRWKEEGPGKPLRLGRPPRRTAQLLALGKRIYQKLQCGQCHGETGKGDGPSAETLVDERGRPIFPYDFTVPGMFKGGSSPRDIVRTFLTGMDGTPMPAYLGTISRREAWALAYYCLSLGRGGKPPARTGKVIVAAYHKGELPLSPFSRAWRKATPVVIGLQPLWWRKDFITHLQVRALYNDTHIAFLVEWRDETPDRTFLTHQSFRDAVALQFPLDSKGVVPFFGMGAHDRPVNIWHWKADWQADLEKWRDIDEVHPRLVSDWYPFRLEGFRPPLPPPSEGDKIFLAAFAVGNTFALPRRGTPVEDLNATGQGTLTPQPPKDWQVEGKGVWWAGKWHVVFRRALRTPDPYDVQFRPGTEVPIAFALWDGDAGDRDGQKLVTAWQTLRWETKKR